MLTKVIRWKNRVTEKQKKVRLKIFAWSRAELCPEIRALCAVAIALAIVVPLFTAFPAIPKEGVLG